MPWYWITVLVVFGLLIGIPIGIYALGYLALWRAEIEYCDDEISLKLFTLAEQDFDVAAAEALGFQPEAALRTKSLEDLIFYSLVWRHGEDETYLQWLCMESDLRVETVEIMIISELSTSPNLSLTTGSGKANHDVPLPPGDYIQTFSAIDIKESWRRHQESEAHLINHFDITEQPVRANLIDLLQRSSRESSQYILRRPWLLFAVVYRYWLGRHLLHNKSIIERGV